MEDPQSSSHPHKSINAIKTCSKQTNEFQKDQPQVKTRTVNEIRTPKRKEPKKTLENEFKKLHLNLSVLEVLAHAPIYNAILDKYVESLELGIVKNVEVHIGKLKLLEDFYAIDMEKDLATLLLVGRGFLATTSVVIDCKKAKIAVGEGVTRSIFRVKEINLGDEEVPYWTTLGKRESYEPRDDIVIFPGNEIFLVTESGDGVRIFPDVVASPVTVIFPGNEKFKALVSMVKATNVFIKA
ncbi:MAK10-like protein [Tanacetum coccineum]